MLTCAVNVSEGRDTAALDALAAAAGDALLDLHADPWHHRSVLTLGGTQLPAAVRRVARAAVELLDLRSHAGVHPRLGVLDVVPFTPYPVGEPLDEAVAARSAFASWAASELGLACFYYGPGRSLPEVRRRAFRDLAPDTGPATPDPARGACCVGARGALVAYNLVLERADLALARRVAAAVRSPELRTLGLPVGKSVQVSCNLVEPLSTGPAHAYDLVAGLAPVRRAELVGLLPAAVLHAVPPARWDELGISAASTLEARLARPGKPEGGVPPAGALTSRRSR